MKFYIKRIAPFIGLCCLIGALLYAFFNTTDPGGYSQILDACSFVALFFVPYFIFSIKKLDELISFIGYRPMIVGIIISIAGIANCVCSFAISSHEIGSLYEDSHYTENYEAVISQSDLFDRSISCIVEINADTNSESNSKTYTITKIYLPFNRELEYISEEYEPGQDNNIPLGYLGRDWFLEIVRPVDKFSFSNLDKQTVATEGDYCASRNGEAYHYLDCRSVDTINRENLVFFHDEIEPDALGYVACEHCQ